MAAMETGSAAWPGRLPGGSTVSVVVATAIVDHDRPGTIEPSVIDFLNSKVIVHWAEVTLGL